MGTEGGNFHTITSFNMEEDFSERGKKKEIKLSRGTPECNLKMMIFITILWLCVIVLVEYLFIWKLFPELPGEIVGRVRIKISFYNLSYTDDLASSDFIRYKNLSGEFITLVDGRLKNSSLADYYARSEVDGFENGSVIIKFTSTFKQKNRMLPLMNRIDYVLKNDIFPDKFNINLENTAFVEKSKPEIISYELVRETLPAIMTPSTPTSSDMTLTASSAEYMTDTTTTKSTTARTTFISGLISSASITISETTSSASIAISLVSSTNSATTTTTTASTTSVSKTTSSATITPVSTNSTTV
ncbi:hypothetical protein CHS0354_043135 [Potamilus streckersoni]|uniref:SEA domain-containing protein n=1 Tax=Potamilus streckersoni TaxID=2493646 RepID=A0AAE0SC30_9BIVA|nr:hypothetical protein CHS0354_043135 [Potamilus streckersoni]